jgi:hypothetical protein
MPGRKGRHITNKSVAIVVAILFVASVFLFLCSVPEQVVGVSQDGLVSASGLTRSVESLTIERIDNVDTDLSRVVSPVYQVSLSGTGNLERGELVMHIEGDRSLSEIMLYTFDRSTLAWREMPTLFDLADSSISTSLEFTGSLMIVAAARE